MAVAAGVVVALWSQQPNYVLLFDNLADRDKLAVTEALSAEQTDFRIDESTGAQLVRMSKAIQLLGTRPVISGVSPAVAQTMIQTDVALKSIKTVRSLKDGLQWFLPGGGGGESPDDA